MYTNIPISSHFYSFSDLRKQEYLIVTAEIPFTLYGFALYALGTKQKIMNFSNDLCFTVSNECKIITLRKKRKMLTLPAENGYHYPNNE